MFFPVGEVVCEIIGREMMSSDADGEVFVESL
jgi:hypothetical protein